MGLYRVYKGIYKDYGMINGMINVSSAWLFQPTPLKNDEWVTVGIMTFPYICICIYIYEMEQ